MLTRRYLASVKNLSSILTKIVDGVAPDKFTIDHLRSIGFTSSGDRAVIPLLKDLGFLSADGTPLPRYHAYRDRSRSRAVMAEALRDAYADVFHIREMPTPGDREAIEGLFKSKHNSTDRVAQLQAMTFYGLLGNADLKAPDPGVQIQGLKDRVPDGDQSDSNSAQVDKSEPTAMSTRLTTELHYTIQVHLPATKDVEVFNAIFRSLRENLLS